MRPTDIAPGGLNPGSRDGVSGRSGTPTGGRAPAHDDEQEQANVRGHRSGARTATTAVALVALLMGCASEPDDGPAPETDEPAPEDDEPEESPEPAGVAPLTGVEIHDEDVAEALGSRPAVTVKIPNDPPARPHTGLEEADVVYEQETEGGVTRFAAVFHSSYPEVVGNVRSARFVDVPLVAPYRGVMVYSGARPEVQGRIDGAGITRVTEGGPGFYRDSARSSPHNLYTRLPEAAEARDADRAAPAPWTFGEEAPAGGQEITGLVSISVSRSATTGWEYDEDEEVFRRHQDGAPHQVTGDGVIGAANVVVLDVPVGGRDSHGAPQYDLDASGDALLLRDGRAYEVRWEKDGVTSPLEVVDGADEAVLAPGPTWVVLTYDGAITRVEGIGPDTSGQEDEQ